MQNNKKLHTFKDSPAFKYFSHWSSDDGLIDAIDARIYHNFVFDRFGGMVIKEVAVTFFPLHRMRKLKYYDHPLHIEEAAMYKRRSNYTSCTGNWFDDWMKDGNVMPPSEIVSNEGVCLGYSPDGDFNFFRCFRFEKIEYAKKALEQFAFIRECEWARDGSIDIASLVKNYTEKDIQAHQIKLIEAEIKAHEYDKKKKAFDAIVDQKISSGEWVVPEGFTVSERHLLFTIDKVHWDKNHPVNVFQRQFSDLQKQIFGD